MFDLLVFIGRFQPFHNEHKRVVDVALKNARKVLVLVGSAGSARTIRNPFTFNERKDMIRGAYYDTEHSKNLTVEPLYDMTYNDTAWETQVQNIVTKTAIAIRNPGSINLHGAGKIGLIGASKDNSSYYLNMFPQWGSMNVPLDHVLHATDIRNKYLEEDDSDIPNLVPRSTDDVLYEMSDSAEMESLRKEYWFAQTYQDQWAVAPYPVKHLTVDAVVEQSGHVLLVRRRSLPGKGKWALPGGHLEMDETLMSGVLRELREETGLKVPSPVLRGSVVESRMFDDPYRSSIGRVVTYASHIKLANGPLPTVKGMDDADKAKWVPISELRECDFFDDHYHIIKYFIGS